MKRVLALVEGQTEESFIKKVLSPYLRKREIVIVPSIVVTKPVLFGRDFRGGVTDYVKVARDLRHLLRDSRAVSVTSFMDYYGLPPNFPGIVNRPPGPPLVRARHVETQWAEDIADPRFHPYLMVHEFEALLFSKPEELSKVVRIPGARQRLKAIRNNFPTPEDINNDPKTAPSKRILRIFPGYHKVAHGTMVAGRIGLQTMRRECPHFDQWVSWLETL